MKMYVMLGYHYAEGTDVLGVFSTLEQAKTECDNFGASPQYTNLIVRELNLNVIDECAEIVYDIPCP